MPTRAEWGTRAPLPLPQGPHGPQHHTREAAGSSLQFIYHCNREETLSSTRGSQVASTLMEKFGSASESTDVGLHHLLTFFLTERASLTEAGSSPPKPKPLARVYLLLLLNSPPTAS